MAPRHYGALEHATHGAEAIDGAVQRFAATGEGGVIYVEGEFLLFVDDRVVVMLIDGDILHVDRVRKA